MLQPLSVKKHMLSFDCSQSKTKNTVSSTSKVQFLIPDNVSLPNPTATQMSRPKLLAVGLFLWSGLTITASYAMDYTQLITARVGE